jgi:hypothetical protein
MKVIFVNETELLVYKIISKSVQKFLKRPQSRRR